MSITARDSDGRDKDRYGSVDSLDGARDILNELLVGEPLDGAWVRLLDASWDVRVDDLDDPTETFEADLRIDRVTIKHRGIDVVAIVLG